jgi:hypothetical protein
VGIADELPPDVEECTLDAPCPECRFNSGYVIDGAVYCDTCGTRQAMPGQVTPEPLHVDTYLSAVMMSLKKQQRCSHDQWRWGVVRQANGTRQIIRGCRECGADVGPKQFYSQHECPDQLADLPILRDYLNRNPPCRRCGAWGAELHHFAPRDIFGSDEADLWPTAYLCPRCHAHWHSTMHRA